jgi:hypothetical protein
LLNQLADYTVATVEALRVCAVEVPYQAGKVTLARWCSTRWSWLLIRQNAIT